MSHSSRAEIASRVVDLLQTHEQRLVLAESCTGGLIAATLAGIAGVSQWWCGSAVTYREATKVSWLGVEEDAIEQYTAVSESVASQMASGVLKQTPEATIAAAITGHLGPNAPEIQDGVVFIGIATPQSCSVTRHQLVTQLRADRQSEAAELVLHQIATVLSDPSS